jgi:hypothetical protein
VWSPECDLVMDHTFDRDPMVEIKSKNSELLLYIIFPILEKKKIERVFIFVFSHLTNHVYIIYCESFRYDNIADYCCLTPLFTIFQLSVFVLLVKEAGVLILCLQ